LLLKARRIDRVAEPMYFYRRARPGSISSTFDARYEHLPEALGIALDAFAEPGLMSRMRPALMEYALVPLLVGRYSDFFLGADGPTSRHYASAVLAFMDERFPGWRHDAALADFWPSGACRAVSTNGALLAMWVSMPAPLQIRMAAHLGFFRVPRRV
jgi:hypothetical protein